MNHHLIRLRSLLLQVGNEVLQRVKDPAVFPYENPNNEIITLTGADISSDTSLVKFYVSILASEERKREIIDGLNKAKNFIRREFAKELCIKNIPSPLFILDDTQDRVAHLNDLFAKIKSQEQETEPE
ncbi:30S ribosome-binding factor RbfA [bacterium]|nr:30S ribosome-binding factor RbfA [bacterium]